jgi:hypothetical protein
LERGAFFLMAPLAKGEQTMINLTDFFPLWTLAPCVASGKFDPRWDRTYHTVNGAGGSRCYPVGGGCGQTLRGPKLLAAPYLPAAVAALDDGRKGFIYVLTSTLYPILYVGISDGTLREGVFGPGRLGHHLRKIFACHASATSHTEGWPGHAVTRYQDRVGLHARGLGSSSLFDDTLLGGDLMLAFGAIDGFWAPENFEGTVLDAVREALIGAHHDLNILNRGKVRREPARVMLPTNLDALSQELMAQRQRDRDAQQSEIAQSEWSLELKSLARRLEPLAFSDPDLFTRLCAGLGRDFRARWVDAWHEQLTTMAEGWEHIDGPARIVVDVARLGGQLNVRIASQILAVFDVYAAATRAMDLDGGDDWKLAEVNALRAVIADAVRRPAVTAAASAH